MMAKLSRAVQVALLCSCSVLAACGATTGGDAAIASIDKTDASLSGAQDATPTDAAADVTAVDGSADTVELVDALADSTPDVGCPAGGCACTTVSQCSGDHPTCLNGVCGNALPCVSDNSCKSKQQVCDLQGSGTCVDCVKDVDCGATQQCIAFTCHDAPTTSCLSSKNCPGTQVCDPGLGKCVQCANNGDCPGQICVQTVCVAPLCTPGATVCIGNQRQTCAANGLSVSAFECPTGCANGQCIIDADAKSSQYEDIGYLDGMSQTSQNVPLPDGAVCATKCPTVQANVCGYPSNCGVPCGGCSPGTSKCVGSKCEACKPNCPPGACGSDGCSGFCPACSGGSSCSGNKCVAACDLCMVGNCDFFDFNSDLSGWDLSGDATLVTSLGTSIPPDGGKMLRLSTGLGATTEASTARKALCIPMGATHVRLIWRFYSEELKEFCGSQYQDEFLAKLVVGGKTLTLLDMRVDDLCEGGKQFIGLTKSDVGFDQGDVWYTPWHETVVAINLPPGSSDAVLSLVVQDAGDGIYDTVVLMDDIQFLP
jgi:hypothetical protein